MVHSFKTSRHQFRLGISLLVFFSGFTILSLIAAILEGPHDAPLGQRIVGGLPLGFAWLLFNLLPAWLLLDYSRRRLLIGTKSVAIRGVIRTKRISFQDVHNAKWAGARQLRLKANQGRVTLHILEYVTYERERLVMLLHERIDSAVEQGWEEAESKLMETLRRSADPRRYNQEMKRLGRLLFCMPVLGLLVGVGAHVAYGRHEELGWAGSLVAVGAVAGFGGGAFLLVMGIWNWWMGQPEVKAK